MKRFEAVAPNEQYNGVTCGVRFTNGRAYVDELTVNKHLGYTVDDVAKMLQKDHGYKVTLLEGGGKVVVK